MVCVCAYKGSNWGIIFYIRMLLLELLSLLFSLVYIYKKRSMLFCPSYVHLKYQSHTDHYCFGSEDWHFTFRFAFDCWVLHNILCFVWKGYILFLIWGLLPIKFLRNVPLPPITPDSFYTALSHQAKPKLYHPPWPNWHIITQHIIYYLLLLLYLIFLPASLAMGV